MGWDTFIRTPLPVRHGMPARYVSHREGCACNATPLCALRHEGTVRVSQGGVRIMYPDAPIYIWGVQCKYDGSHREGRLTGAGAISKAAQSAIATVRGTGMPAYVGMGCWFW